MLDTQPRQITQAQQKYNQLADGALQLLANNIWTRDQYTAYIEGLRDRFGFTESRAATV